MKKKRMILIVFIGIMVSGIVLMYSSYALFSANQINKSAITIKVGTMNGTIKVDGTITSKLTLDKGKKQTFVVTLENLNSIEGKFLPYYIGELPTGVTFGYMEATGIDLPNETNLSKNGKKTYSIYLENNANASVTINLGVQGGLANQPISLPTNGHLIPQAKKENKNISNIWKYDQTSGSSTFCVTGEETTCLPINPEVFESGTIIKYKVNDTTEKYFHVISDDGDTLTLQQRENTIYTATWYTGTNDSTKGPTTILTTLESATSNWTNVLNQTYTLGTTTFKDNAFTGCSVNAANNITCTKNTYALPTRTAKARMITMQELLSLGCSTVNQSCPVWVYNYLKDSINNGGTVNQTGGDYGNNYYYWTATANSSTTSYAWYVDSRGRGDGSFTSTNGGARAVIQIEKSRVIKPRNENITHVYQYNQTTGSNTFCVTGEESTCIELDAPDTYTPGTIVKYKVNDNEEKYFHVMFDNKDTLTLQQRENTVNKVAWYATANDYSKGPLTALAALESATSTWSNVPDQTYTLGTTVFKDNFYTGCTGHSSCSLNSYTLPTRTAKARLITIQEIGSFGCTVTHSTTSCPVWVHNYLKKCTDYGGTVDGTVFSYWTSSAHSNTQDTVFVAYYLGTYFAFLTTSSDIGVRAVIVIPK